MRLGREEANPGALLQRLLQEWGCYPVGAPRTVVWRAPWNYPPEGQRAGCLPTFSRLSLVGDHSAGTDSCTALLSEPRKLWGREEQVLKEGSWE